MEESRTSASYLGIRPSIYCKTVFLKRDRFDAEFWGQAVQVRALQVGHLRPDRGRRDREHTIIAAFEVRPLLNQPS